MPCDNFVEHIGTINEFGLYWFRQGKKWAVPALFTALAVSIIPVNRTIPPHKELTAHVSKYQYFALFF